MKTILITGGLGFIGKNLTEYLLKTTNYKIIILDLLSKQPVNSNRITYYQDTISNCNLDYIFTNKNISTVIHLSTNKCIKDPVRLIKTNVLGTANILNYCVKYNIKNFILGSSGIIIGNQKLPVHENLIPTPISPYGASKSANESLCFGFSSKYNINTTILRFSNTYGQYSQNKSTIISNYIKSIFNNEPFYLNGNGSQTRDFIYVGDLVRSIYLCINKPQTTIYQVASGHNLQINHLIFQLKRLSEKHFNRKVRIVMSDPIENEIKDFHYDIDKIKKELNWEPSTTLTDGLLKTINWYKDNFKNERTSDL